MRKNDNAWKILFEKYSILEKVESEKVCYIKATDIKELREPRLMAKIDHKTDLPTIFKENDLGLLPLSRGEYVIGKFDLFYNLPEKDSKVSLISIPSYLQTLTTDMITNEAMALNCAYSANILSDFLEDEELVPSVNGRMGSGIFSFNIKTKEDSLNIEVHKAQIEIDSAYEGRKYLSLFEAKNNIYEDFIIRQLYYPYRTWKDRINKDIKSVFLTYLNGCFSLYQFEFANPFNYNSITLVKQKNYQIAPHLKCSDIQEKIKETPIVTEPNDISFPQADKFERVINILELLSIKQRTKAELTDKYGFDPRQTNYYTDAARYLNLVQKETHNNTITFSLTALGKKVMKLSYREKQLELINLILAHISFRKVYELYIVNKEMPPRFKIVQIMKESSLKFIEAESTYNRRASTVIGWINWIVQQLD